MVRRLLIQGELTPRARLLTGAAGVALLVAIVLPLWQMTMISNQYPEGLRMRIYSYQITGDLQEINTLNHYIGMQQLKAANFPELRVLPLMFGIGGVLCLLAAVVRRRLITTVVLAGGLLAGLGSMVLLFSALYRYGHNLDPRAAIDVKPFMPLPLGRDRIANFQVTTFLHLGSVLFILALVGLAAALWISRSAKARAETSAPVTSTTLIGSE